MAIVGGNFEESFRKVWSGCRSSLEGVHRVLRSLVEVQCVERQNVEIQIVDFKM
jgi:hypothetical protein